jgi:hypothetical protein
MPCGSLEVRRRFGEMHRLHLGDCFAWLSDPEDGIDTFLRNVRELLSNYNGVTKQKTVLLNSVSFNTGRPRPTSRTGLLPSHPLYSLGVMTTCRG